MPRGPKAVALELSDAERGELHRLPRRHRVGAGTRPEHSGRAGVYEPGVSNVGVATALGGGRQAMTTWRGRFAEHRLEGLTMRHDPGCCAALVTTRSSSRSPQRLLNTCRQ